MVAPIPARSSAAPGLLEYLGGVGCRKRLHQLLRDMEDRPVVDLCDDAVPAVQHPSLAKVPVLVSKLIDGGDVMMPRDGGVEGGGVQDDGGGHAGGLLTVLLPELRRHLVQHPLGTVSPQAVGDVLDRLFQPGKPGGQGLFRQGDVLAQVGEVVDPAFQPTLPRPSGGSSVGVQRQRGVLIRSPLYRAFQVRLADEGEGLGDAERHRLLHSFAAGVERHAEPRGGVLFDGGGWMHLGFDDERLPAVMHDQDVGAESRLPAHRPGLFGARPPPGVPSIQRPRQEQVQLRFSSPWHASDPRGVKTSTPSPPDTVDAPGQGEASMRLM